MQNGYGGIDTLTVFPVLYRLFFLFSEQTPVLLDAELGFVDTLKPPSRAAFGIVETTGAKGIIPSLTVGNSVKIDN